MNRRFSINVKELLQANVLSLSRQARSLIWLARAHDQKRRCLVEAFRQVLLVLAMQKSNALVLGRGVVEFGAEKL